MAKQTGLSIYDIITPKLALVYMRDPARFVREVIFNKNWRGFGGKYEITKQQEEMFNALAHGKKNVSVRAGRGVGKSAFLSWLVLWWICVKGDTQVVLTAPSFPQLKSVLWKAVGDWLQKSAIKDCFVYTSEKLYRKDNIQVWAEPRTASKIESANGLHNPSLLIIADEASGIQEDILEAFYGSLTEAGNRMFLMFNPTKITGFAYDSHNKDKNLWTTLKFSSIDSEIVDRGMIEDATKKHCPGGIPDDWYKANILGEFPTGNPDALFTLEEVYEARDRVYEPSEDDEVNIGVDLAEMGTDLTVVAPRWGMKVLSAKDIGYGPDDVLCAWGQTKAPETIKKILNIVELTRRKTKYAGIITIRCDNGGLGGPIISFLEERQKEYGIKVVRVNFGGTGKIYDEDNNEATAMWFNVKNLIDKIKLPYDEQLIEEMVSRNWSVNESNGKREIERKKIFKERYHASPDRADAVMLSFSKMENARNFAGSYTDKTNRVEIPCGSIENTGNQYLGLYLNTTGIMSAVAASYWNGKLGVYDHVEGPVDHVMRDEIFSRPYKLIIGSDSMFNDGDSVSFKLLRNSIPVLPPFNYDEGGSIYGLDNLIASEMFVTGAELTDFKKKMDTWTVDRGRSTVKETHGCCYALLQIISVLIMQHSNFIVEREKERHYGRKY